VVLWGAMFTLCVFAVFVGRAVAAAPGVPEKFPVETIYRGELEEIAPGPEGSMWYVQSSEYPFGVEGRIERIASNGVVTGAFTEGEQVLGDIAKGPDGNMWFTVTDTQERNFIGRITPAGGIEKFSVPINSTGIVLLFAGPQGIAAGADGNMWFTDNHEDAAGKTFIGRITPQGKVTEFPLVSPAASSPAGIALGADGNMWFTDDGVNAQGQSFIGRITPAGTITEFPLATAHHQPISIALGADGNMWFTDRAATESGGSFIGRITPAGAITEYPVAGINGALNGITLGPDGNMWFTGNPEINPISWITPAGIVHTLPFESLVNTYPSSIATGFNNYIWFTDLKFSAPEMVTTSFVGRFLTPFPPVNTAAPTLAGPATEGQVLSVSNGAWTNEPSAFAYQWQSCDAAGANCEDLPGDTEPSLFLTSSQAGHTLRVLVSASNVAGAASSVSSPSAVVAKSAPSPAPPVVPAPPAQPRPPVVGATLTWRFAWSHVYTVVKSLIAHGLPAGSFVQVGCKGRGCAFLHVHATASVGTRSCRKGKCTKKRIAARSELSLSRLFKSGHLRPGTRITVGIVRAGWIGKSYAFTVRKGQAPDVALTCLAPGSTSTVEAC